MEGKDEPGHLIREGWETRATPENLKGPVCTTLADAPDYPDLSKSRPEFTSNLGSR